MHLCDMKKIQQDKKSGQKNSDMFAWQDKCDSDNFFPQIQKKIEKMK